MIRQLSDSEVDAYYSNHKSKVYLCDGCGNEIFEGDRILKWFDKAEGVKVVHYDDNDCLLMALCASSYFAGVDDDD